ncbi:MAG: ATP-binding protein [Caulobacteraceae bacterium]
MALFDGLRARVGAGRGRIAGAGPAIAERWTASDTAGARAPRRWDSGLPRFRSTASDQIEPHLTDPLASVRISLRNAFTPSKPISDQRVFAGRMNTLTSLIRSIEDQQLHVVVHGERGIGKTSVLNILAEAAVAARYLQVYISCGERSNFDEIVRAVAGRIPLLYVSGFGPTHAETEKGGTLGDLLEPGAISTRMAADMLAKVSGTRVLLFLDEFERCESVEFRTQIAELMKDLSDRSARVQLVVAGIASDLTELMEAIPSIQRSIYALELPRMSGDEVRQLVSKGEKVGGVTFRAPATDLIVSLAAGFPYLASLLAHHSALAALDGGRTSVVRDDVATAAEGALEELKSRLSRRSQWHIEETVRGGGLAALGAIAAAAQSASGRFTPEDIASRAVSVEQRDLQLQMAEALARDGALLKEANDEYGKGYNFIEPSVPPYLWLLALKAKEGAPA